MQSSCNSDGAPSHQVNWYTHIQNPRLDQSSNHLLSRYICNPSFLKQLSPSTSSSLVVWRRFGGLDEISPIGDPHHLGRCTVDILLQNRGSFSRQSAQQSGRVPPNSRSKPFFSLASSSWPWFDLQPILQTSAYLSWQHRPSSAVFAPVLHCTEHCCGCFQ